MSTSPMKESIIPKLPPPVPASLLDPPSPRTHRALRRLQSAHSLGQSNNSQPSLITQQHKQAIQRAQTPPNTSSTQHSRGRSNSDATNMIPPTLGAAGRRPISNKRPIAADALSLDRLIRDGPPDGDIVGALESTRLKILGQGIKSDTDGMVRSTHPSVVLC
jgi:cell cycle arrest protein BUB2